jgi:hypothetical protein
MIFSRAATPAVRQRLPEQSAAVPSGCNQEVAVGSQLGRSYVQNSAKLSAQVLIEMMETEKGQHIILHP